MAFQLRCQGMFVIETKSRRAYLSPWGVRGIGNLPALSRKLTQGGRNSRKPLLMQVPYIWLAVLFGIVIRV